MWVLEQDLVLCRSSTVEPSLQPLLVFSVKKLRADSLNFKLHKRLPNFLLLCF